MSVDDVGQTFRVTGGSRINRKNRVRFRFDGVELEGYQGDSLASALLANGVHLVGRSFKYHRPRGILSAGSEEPNALITVRRFGGRVTPNLRATEVEIYHGLDAISQNRWPSLRFDAGAISDRLSRLFPAGFYYKTLMGPRFIGSNRIWPRVFEPLIRRAAGLGRVPLEADPDTYAHRFAHCDVLVIGGGPAGLAAALTAADEGGSVILCDERPVLGGSLDWWCPEALIDGSPSGEWAKATIGELARRSNVRVLPRTTAFGAYAQNYFGLAERITDHLANPHPRLPRERLWQVRTKRAVLAMGAIEQPLVFSGNDRPGVMLAGAVEAYIGRYGVRPGTRAVVWTSSDDGYRTALVLQRSGIEVAGIIDLRPGAGDAALAAALEAGIRVEANTRIVATSGRLRIAGVHFRRLSVTDATGRSDPGRDHISCDLLVMSGGWMPAVHLYSQARGKLVWDDVAGAFLPDGLLPDVRVAGAARGIEGLAEAAADGAIAGRSSRLLQVPPLRGGTETATKNPARYGRDDGDAGTAFVDFQNDVTVKDLRIATREGFRSIEHIKRYTTTGMATDQGKTSNVAALTIVADALGKGIGEVGYTTFRPPYTPVTFGTLAGHSRSAALDPVRRTPVDPWARQRGAVFEDVGQWQRARYFPRMGEDMRAAVLRECRSVRNSCGIFDASTLGKIEVVGPDAATFLDRMYLPPLARLGIGRCRYGIQLNEAGFVIDDGIVARLAVDRFHVTTTTGGASPVLHLMEDYLQTEFSELKCWLTSITEQWGVIAVQGPNAREVIAPLVAGVDLSAEAMPHMSVGVGTICGIPMRLFRVSFTGERGYEINIASGYAGAVWEHVHERVVEVGGCAYGTETMHVLRAEKGYIIVGQESDGTVTPRDLGFGDGSTKKDFVGKRALARPDMVKPDRPGLVGLKTVDPALVLDEGAQLTSAVRPLPGTRADGYVTSSYFSAALGRSIALGLVVAGRKRQGERLHVPMSDGPVAVEIVSPVFFDIAGERLHG